MKKGFVFILVALIALSSVFANGTTEQAAVDKYPADTLQYLVAASAGGGLDIISRCFTPQWEKELDTTFEYVYENTGNTYLMAMNDLNALDDDEFGVICGMPEAMLGAFQFQESKYSLNDIAWIGNVYSDANCIIVRKDDTRFNTAEDLIAYAKENRITISTPQTLTSANITAKVFVEASGIKATVVPYNGGSPARNDLIGGHVDVSIGGVSTVVNLSDQVKVIGIFGDANRAEDLWPNAQLQSEFAKDFELPNLTAHCSIWTSKKIAEKNPEVYQMLVETFKNAFTSEEAGTALKTAKQDRFVEYFGPEETESNSVGFVDTLVKYSDLLDPAKNN